MICKERIDIFMKWIKKWSFLVMLLLAGAIFFTATDNWMVLAKPYGAPVRWYQEQVQKVQGEVQLVKGGNTATAVSNGAVVTGKVENLEKEKEHTLPGEMTEQMPVGEALENEQEQESTQQAEIITSRATDEVEYIAVEDDYFADAVFIGDSRTVGMFEYGGLKEVSTFYASTGLTIYKLLDAEIVSVPGQKEKQTIEQALSERQFSKIYLMIGINEMGQGTVETFVEKYQEVLNRLQELQPDAIIYVQGIIKVTTERSEKGDYIHNEGIEARNEALAGLADYVKIYYLDVNPLICDETGGMKPDYTSDGVHLKAQYIPIWKDFLKQHGAVLP